VHQTTVGEWVKGNASDSKFLQAPASRQHFDVWEFPPASGESSYFGTLPAAARAIRRCGQLLKEIEKAHGGQAHPRY
jgi:hypothetical protein